MSEETLRLVVRLPCEPCGGTGDVDEGFGRETCPACDGEGEQESTLTLGELRLLVADWIVNPLVPAGELDELVESLKRSMVAAALKSEGLADADEAGSWLRAVQEAAEALRAVAELRPRVRED